VNGTVCPAEWKIPLLERTVLGDHLYSEERNLFTLAHMVLVPLLGMTTSVTPCASRGPGSATGLRNMG